MAKFVVGSNNGVGEGLGSRIVLAVELPWNLVKDTTRLTLNRFARLLAGVLGSLLDLPRGGINVAS